MLAIGFGREFRRPDIPAYWDGDGITSTNDKTSTWLVSGYGDGALTDLARLLVKNFDHAKLVKLIIEDEDLTKEVAAQVRDHTSIRAALDNVAPGIRDKIKHRLEIRSDTEVKFCAPRESYLESNESCLLNRFLVYLLEDQVKFQKGQLSHVPAQRQEAPFYQVSFVKGANDVDDPDPAHDSFYGIMPRHGVDSEQIDGKRVPKVWATPGLKEIWDRCEFQRSRWKDLGKGLSKFDDRTRVPIFDGSRFVVVPFQAPLLPENRKSVDLRLLVVSSSLEPPPGTGSLYDLVAATIPSRTFSRS